MEMAQALVRKWLDSLYQGTLYKLWAGPSQYSLRLLQFKSLSKLGYQ
jgi:hypothetical protein